MATDVKTLLRLSVPVIVQIGQRHLRVGDVMSLAPGVIMELGKPAEEELELLVNNKTIGRGVAVKVGENFGIRINTIGSPRQRVEAMGT